MLLFYLKQDNAVQYTWKILKTVACQWRTVPNNRDSVPEEEKHKHFEVLATCANCISRGSCDLGTANGV